ncbi:hypothetical protein ACIP88_05285 [Streptomyces uncialis]|uniref:hypothetical protein n=1 Tax=Streptomyces uncialis TaxID=1048205 RepID=UPI00381CCB2E
MDDLRDQMKAHVDAALALLDVITDPVEREAAARILGDDLIPDAALRVKEVRGDALRALRAQGLTLRAIAELTGLSVPRVDQIVKGVSRPGRGSK